MIAKLFYFSVSNGAFQGEGRQMVLGAILGLVEGALDWSKSAGQPCLGVLGEPPTLPLLWLSGHNIDRLF